MKSGPVEELGRRQAAEPPWTYVLGPDGKFHDTAAEKWADAVLSEELDDAGQVY